MLQGTKTINLLLIYTMFLGGLLAGEPQLSEKAVLDALKGDKSARASVAKADKGKVLRRLQLIALQPSMDPSIKREALEIIKSIPGHALTFVT